MRAIALLCMTDNDKELIIYRISCGHLRCHINGQVYLYKYPSLEDKYVAEELYQSSYTDALFNGALSDNQLALFLAENKIWTTLDENKLSNLNKDIEEIKCKLYESILKSNDRKVMKKKLSEAKKSIEELSERKHSFDMGAARGIAALAKARYLTTVSIYNVSHQRMFNVDTIIESNIVDCITQYINDHRIGEAEYREIARTEPWRSSWFCKKACKDIFSRSAIELTDEQKMLIYWSQLYDSVYEHPQVPHEDIIEDDDMLDGWFISQRRQREKKSNRELIESQITNPKIKESGEIFIMAQTPEDIKRIDDANDPQAAATKRRRLEYIKKKGEVNEADMPDVKLKLQQLSTTMYAEKMKG